jgi:hypothetical protein
MGGSDYKECLEFVRHELRTLAGARLLRGLGPTDDLRYLELGRKEKTLLAERNRRPTPVTGGRWEPATGEGASSALPDTPRGSPFAPRVS